MNYWQKLIVKYALKLKVVTAKLDSLRVLIKGKKAYLTAGGLIVAALIEYANTGDAMKLINDILAASAVVTIRAAIPKKEA